VQLSLLALARLRPLVLARLSPLVRLSPLELELVRLSPLVPFLVCPLSCRLGCLRLVSRCFCHSQQVLLRPGSLPR